MNSDTSEKVSFENLKFNPFSTNQVLQRQNLDPHVNLYNSVQNLDTPYFSTNYVIELSYDLTISQFYLSVLGE